MRHTAPRADEGLGRLGGAVVSWLEDCAWVFMHVHCDSTGTRPSRILLFFMHWKVLKGIQFYAFAV